MLKCHCSGITFLIREAFIIQEKGFIIAKTYQINKRENMSFFFVSKLLPVYAKNGSPSFSNSLSDRCRQAGKYFCNLQ